MTKGTNSSKKVKNYTFRMKKHVKTEIKKLKRKREKSMTNLCGLVGKSAFQTILKASPSQIKEFEKLSCGISSIDNNKKIQVTCKKELRDTWNKGGETLSETKRRICKNTGTLKTIKKTMRKEYKHQNQLMMKFNQVKKYSEDRLKEIFERFQPPKNRSAPLVDLESVV